jgi:hypothetical protein
VGDKLTIFEFQGTKLLEGATNLDARYSNYNRASGGQSIVDCSVYADTVIVIENTAIVNENIERTLSREHHRESVERTSSKEHRQGPVKRMSLREHHREPVKRTPLRERHQEHLHL